MKQTIWKYQLPIEDIQDVEMPIGAKILSADVQDGNPCIWALVDPQATKEARTIEMFGTGHSISVDIGGERIFIGTILLLKGKLVYHLFEYIGV